MDEQGKTITYEPEPGPRIVGFEIWETWGTVEEANVNWNATAMLKLAGQRAIDQGLMIDGCDVPRTMGDPRGYFILDLAHGPILVPQDPEKIKRLFDLVHEAAPYLSRYIRGCVIERAQLALPTNGRTLLWSRTRTQLTMDHIVLEEWLAENGQKITYDPVRW